MIKNLIIFLGLLWAGVAWAGQEVYLQSGARTTTQTLRDNIKTTERGVHVVIVVTAVTALETLTPRIQGKDALGNYYDVLVGTAIGATGTYVFKVYPGINPVAGGAASDIIPTVWRITITPSASGSFTYSVTANVEP